MSESVVPDLRVGSRNKYVQVRPLVHAFRDASQDNRRFKLMPRILCLSTGVGPYRCKFSLLFFLSILLISRIKFSPIFPVSLKPFKCELKIPVPIVLLGTQTYDNSSEIFRRDVRLTVGLHTLIKEIRTTEPNE